MFYISLQWLKLQWLAPSYLFNSPEMFQVFRFVDNFLNDSFQGFPKFDISPLCEQKGQNL